MIPGLPGQQSQPIQAPQVVQGQLPPVQSHQSSRYSPQSNPGSYISGHQGRDSAPLVRDGSVLGAPVPVIQPVPAQDTHHQYSSSAPGVIQPRYTPGPDYSTLTSRAYIPLAAASPYHHSMSYPHASYPTPSNYVAGKSLGSAPVYGAPPVYPQQPLHPSHSPYLYTHYPPGSNPTLPYPPGPMAPLPTPQPLPPTAFPPSSGYKVASPPLSSFQPVSSSTVIGDTVLSVRQPIMSSTAQPPSYPAYSAYQGMIPVMMMPAAHPSHHYSPSFPLTLPGTPSSPPVGYAPVQPPVEQQPVSLPQLQETATAMHQHSQQQEGGASHHTQDPGATIHHHQEGGGVGQEESGKLPVVSGFESSTQ